MSDAIIIHKFLTNEFNNDHPIVYLYVCGQERSQASAINKAMGLLKDIFCPPYTVEFIKQILIEFLNSKKEQYKNGKINVKPLY